MDYSIVEKMNESLIEQAKLAEVDMKKLEEAQTRLVDMIVAQKTGQSPIYADLISIIATLQESSPDCMGGLLKPTLRAVRRSYKRLGRFVSNAKKMTYGRGKYSHKETD